MQLIEYAGRFYLKRSLDPDQTPGPSIVRHILSYRHNTHPQHLCRNSGLIGLRRLWKAVASDARARTRVLGAEYNRQSFPKPLPSVFGEGYINA
jgi:hypothetical protein